MTVLHIGSTNMSFLADVLGARFLTVANRKMQEYDVVILEDAQAEVMEEIATAAMRSRIGLLVFANAIAAIDYTPGAFAGVLPVLPSGTMLTTENVSEFIYAAKLIDVEGIEMPSQVAECTIKPGATLGVGVRLEHGVVPLLVEWEIGPGARVVVWASSLGDILRHNEGRELLARLVELAVD